MARRKTKRKAKNHSTDVLNVSQPNKKIQKTACVVCKKKSVFPRLDLPAICNGCKTSVRNLNVVCESNAPASAYICDWCRKSFLHQHMLEEHYSESKDCRPYVCQCCGCSFPFVEQLEEHSKQHTDTPLIIFECELCSTQFQTTGELEILRYDDEKLSAIEDDNVFDEITDDEKQEMETDNDTVDSKQMCVCHGCRGRNVKESEHPMNELEEEGTTDNKVYPCHFSDEVLTSETLLTAQAQKCHSLKYSCPLCKASFSSMASVARHAQVHESYCLRNFPCKICNSNHEGFLQLELHLKEHFKKDVSLCYRCGQVFEFANLRKVHLPNCVGGDMTDAMKDLNAPAITCRSCDKVFPSPSLLIDHVKESHSCRIYVCPICHMSFHFLWDLAQHALSHESYCLRNFPCKICSSTHKTFFLLESHLKEHFGKPVSLCANCGLVFKSITCRDAHMLECEGDDMTHTVVDLYESLLTCQICDKHFLSPILVADHERKFHQPYVCLICTETFKSTKLLTGHMSRIHDSYCLREFPCKICGLMHKTYHLLEVHLRDHFHKHVTLCVSCGQIFESNKYRDEHMPKCKGGDMTHTIVDRLRSLVTCRFCDTEFASPSLLADHVNKTHSGAKFLCSICKQRLQNRKQMAEHYQTHNSYCLRNYRCTICKVIHKSFHHLELHLKEHFERPVTLCISCGQVFESEECRDAHMRECKGGDMTDSIVKLLDSGIPCHLCDRHFPSQRFIVKHDKKYHRRGYKCYECGKTTNTVVGLAQHLENHEIYCLKKFPCKICGLMHSNFHHLESHLREHFNKSVTLCVNCGHVFESVIDRNSHYRRCTGGDMTDTITDLHDKYAPRSLPKN